MKFLFLAVLTFGFFSGASAATCPVDAAVEKAVAGLKSGPGKLVNIKAGGFETSSSNYRTPAGSGEFDQDVTLVFFSYSWTPPTLKSPLDMAGSAVFFGEACIQIENNASALATFQ